MQRRNSRFNSTDISSSTVSINALPRKNSITIDWKSYGSPIKKNKTIIEEEKEYKSPQFRYE